MNRRDVADRPLVYNRINKAGSTSMLRLLQELAFQNNFILLSKGLPKVRASTGPYKYLHVSGQNNRTKTQKRNNVKTR